MDMVKFYKTSDNTKVIATNSTQCVVVHIATKSQSIFTYEFAYPKLGDESLIEIDESTFTERYDIAISKVITLLSKSIKGVKRLLPEAGNISNY